MAVRKRQKGAAWTDKREQILLTAARMFAARGWDGVTVRDIGGACEMHESALYYYFPNKAALYDAAFEWACSASSALLIDALSGDEDPPVKLRRFVSTLVSHLKENGAAAALMDRELLFGDGHRKSDRIPSISRQPLALLEKLVSEIDPPILSSLSASRLSEMLWDISYGAVRYRHVHILVEKHPDRDLETDVLIGEVWAVVECLLMLNRCNAG